ENLESWPVDDANDDVAAFDRAVSKTRALDPAADALVFRALVRVLDGIQRFANTADALAHDLPGPQRVSGVQNITLTDIPPVHTDLLGQHVHDAFHRELRLVAAEAAHRSGVRVVRVDGLGLDVDVRHAVHAARVARRTQRAFGARRVIAACIG